MKMEIFVAIMLGLFLIAIGTAITTAELVVKNAPFTTNLCGSLFLIILGAALVAYGLTKK